jgi:hypothetical protein
MRGAREQADVRKGARELQYPWHLLTREDIYRQRVFGTESGASDFIHIDDKRRMGIIGLIVFIVFLWSNERFTWRRILVQHAFAVNNAAKVAILSSPYQMEPSRKTFTDITSIGDMKAWLLNAFPMIIGEDNSFKYFNRLSTEIRFSLRRMKMKANDDSRFNAFAPTVWETFEGIDPYDKSDEFDDKQAFGAFRRWVQHDVSLSWHNLTAHSCSRNGAELIDELEFSTTTDVNKVVRECKSWCERLVDAKPCRCWTLAQNYRCKFYFYHASELQPTSQLNSILDAHFLVVENEINGWPATPPPEHAFINQNWFDVPAELENTHVGVLMPPIGFSMAELDSKVFWPTMERFMFSQTTNGFQQTPGFVSNLSVAPQDLLIQMAEQKQVAAPTRVKMMEYQIRDWLDGDYLSRGTAALTIDFVTHNTNYAYFTWVQLLFRVRGSGHVEPTLQTESLRVTPSEIEDSDVNTFAAAILKDTWDTFYFLFLIGYILMELFEMVRRGLKYFQSWWNWLTVTCLLLHFIRLMLYETYCKTSEFSKDLETGHRGPDTQEHFLRQIQHFHAFAECSAFTSLFTLMKVVHYLNDLCPRVGILMDTMYHAMTPIIFLMVIFMDMFIGFWFLAYLLFGRTVEAAHTLQDTFMSCTEILFGQNDTYQQISKKHPVFGILFFVSFIVIFYLLLENLTKAVILASYDDASDRFEQEAKNEEARRQAEEERKSDGSTRLLKVVKHRVQKILLKVEKNEKEGPPRKRFPLWADGCIYLFYFVVYIAWVHTAIHMGTANLLTQSMTQAILTPTFEKINPVTRSTSADFNYSTIETLQDVEAFLLQTVPKVMYDTSLNDNFGGQPNRLARYDSALPEAEYKQLVINTWNIVLGQKPVRITVQYFEVEPIGDEAIEHVNSASTLLPDFQTLRDSAGEYDPVEHLRTQGVTDITGIVNTKTRDVLSNHCAYSFGYGSEAVSDKNGFVCMLSVDRGETEAILQDMANNELLMNQTATVAVDFVVYNAYAESFMYVAIVFIMHPSGIIEKSLNTYMIRRLDVYFQEKSAVVLISLEVLIGIITIFYFVNCLVDTCREICIAISQENKWEHYIVAAIRALVLHLFLKPWKMLDLVASCTTIAMFVLWYNLTFRGMSGFFFPEQPVFDKTSCEIFGVCAPYDTGDQQVILQMYISSTRLRLFQRVCACNTWLICARLLKYLNHFGRMRIMFNTWARGFADIFWFLVTIGVVLGGYVWMGHTLFGFKVPGFRTLTQSLLSCFEMFLGTFSYNTLRQDVTLSHYMVFSFSYLFIFRYMLINMFFAIVDKRFQEECEVHAKLLKDRAKAGGGGGLASVLGSWITSIRNRTQALERDIVSGRIVQDIGAGLDAIAGEDADIDSNDGYAAGGGVKESPRHSAAASAAGALATPAPESNLEDKLIKLPLTPDIMAGPQHRNWQLLPENIQVWATTTSTEICRFINEWYERRLKQETEEAKKRPHELERILEEAETAIKEKRAAQRKAAMDIKRELQGQELVKLNEIQEEHEKALWFKRRREAELESLEQRKADKQDRFEKMRAATASLVGREEEDQSPGGGGALSSLLALGGGASAPGVGLAITSGRADGGGAERRRRGTNALEDVS